VRLCFRVGFGLARAVGARHRAARAAPRFGGARARPQPLASARRSPLGRLSGRASRRSHRRDFVPGACVPSSQPDPTPLSPDPPHPAPPPGAARRHRARRGGARRQARRAAGDPQRAGRGAEQGDALRQLPGARGGGVRRARRRRRRRGRRRGSFRAGMRAGGAGGPGPGAAAAAAAAGAAAEKAKARPLIRHCHCLCCNAPQITGPALKAKAKACRAPLICTS
jgi:hypothetical protein